MAEPDRKEVDDMLEGVTSEEVKLARARMDRIRKKIEKMLEELDQRLCV